ncbi:MAG TPA: universal stress protein [Actinomycetota bacterium]|nr:universal stress protein [Actinomycetota bacterium]
MSARPLPDGEPASAAADRLEPATVVVGLDGSEPSWDALAWACGEAQRLGGRVLAVLVSPDAPSAVSAAAVSGVVADATALDQAAAERARELDRELTRRTAGLDVEIAFVHTKGDPARELLALAASHRADLIVVGRSRKARHRIAGSIGRHLVCGRQAPVVVIVP